ncbi:dnaJ protein ERDJ3B-like [Glycine soja]|uniref:dnaJ protein ERDJ3B-like n=1 Tax=Glycine soja TaxID=3848 RepID=UPI001040AA95|nr:dnaJ protein ERDJ3B-like [Glycine soja]
MQVWREKNVIKPAPGIFQQFTEQVCDKCPNVKYERDGYFITVRHARRAVESPAFVLLQEVLFFEDGEPIIDGESGDLRFRIRTAPHGLFRREGNDLHTTVTITLVQALVGYEKTVKHLDEHLVDISTKGITNPKQVRKFNGEGMPLHMSTKKGYLYVTFKVLFPTSLTEERKTNIIAILY